MPAPTPLTAIEQHLNRIQEATSLPKLFTEVLRWGAAPPGPVPVSVGAPVSRDLRAKPVAQLSGLPVFHIDWPRDHLPNLTERRAVHRALRSTYAEHLLCYVTRDHRRASLVWTRPRGDKVEIRTLPYEVGGRARTTLEQVGKLAFTLDELGLFGEPSITQVTDKLDAAFDVEAVNKEFFARYASCFRDEVKPAVGKILRRDADAHAFTQALLNRLMFCWFLQKKGWLGKDGDPEYLLTLLSRAQSQQKSVYHDYLSFLFFDVLANPEEVRRTRQSGDPWVSWEAPFLNGGLFERGKLDKKVEDVRRLERLPNSVFDSVLTHLFARYNFTVEESTSLDVQVALEPELLGTIFERLVTGRHETGSYYTPKPVVEFMCREALAAHLRSAVTAVPAATLEALVYDHSVADLSPADAPAVVRALDTLKVCDPACGSGAYLVTMLHELVAMCRAIYSESLRDPRKDYDLKLRIIQNNLYGVDIDEFAVNIARLRLWLSLVVDNPDTDPKRVNPLPNLDYKIERGDSLTAPNPQDVVGGGLWRIQAAKQADHLARLKGRFMRSSGTQKKQLDDEIHEGEHQLDKDLADAGNPPSPENALDWRVAFAEVFARNGAALAADGGFDIVLANPPYVRADAQFKHLEDEEERQAEIERWKEYRKSLKDGGIYQTLYEKWDLYLPFLERAYQLLRAGGRMVYIMSDAYNGAKYARKSHDFFVRNATVERIDFCSDIPLFEAGVKNSILHFGKAQPGGDHQPVRVRRWGQSKDEFAEHEDVQPSGTQAEWQARVFRSSGAGTVALPGRSVPLSHVCYISYGVAANADEKRWPGEFVTEDVLSDVRDRKHSKPWVEGKDIARWHVRRTRYLEWGTSRAPRKFRRKTFPELHDAPIKLLANRICGEAPAVTVDECQLYSNHTAIIFVPWHELHGVRNRSLQKRALYRDQAADSRAAGGPFRDDLEVLSRKFFPRYVAAVMGSALAAAFLSGGRRGKLDIYPDDWKKLPIPAIPLKEQQPIVDLVDAILEQFRTHGHPLPPAAAAKVAELEQEIDARVNALYTARRTPAGGADDGVP